MGEKTDKDVREKLVSRGAEALSDEELVSIVIGRSPQEQDALEVARALLKEANLSGLASLSLRDLRMKNGLGIRRAAALAAALELGRRMRVEESSRMDTVRTSEDVIKLFQPLLASLPHEEFWVLYLNSANRVTDRVRVSQGGVSGTVVDHKLIVKRAVELLAPAIIVVHNHPSGVAKPSGEDIAMTEKLVTAASLFDIALLDHIILTSGPTYSFRENGLIS